MTRIILRIYDFFHSHRGLGLGLILALTALLVWLISRLSYKEDISDFLPLNADNKKAMAIYQGISGADRLIAAFQYPGGEPGDPDLLVEAVEEFTYRIKQADSTEMVGTITSQADLEAISSLQEDFYRKVPYFLIDEDYARIDSLLATPGYIDERLSDDKRTLMLPSGGMAAMSISHDPLGLFSNLIGEISPTGGRYELYDGYIFSPDMSRAIVLMSSRWGNVETDNNARLVELLESCAHGVEESYPSVEVHLTGGPVIAVGNSRQIMKDSVLAVGFAVVLILALLFYAFRRVVNLLLIALSIGWGWLFALAGLSLCHNSMSIIVVGISSVILGIAVNYPLHYIAHLGHTTDKRKALREIVMPLVVGNITTVGAFLTLVPLRSAALRDLGLFSAFLLVGTILFTIFCLPHLSRSTAPRRGSDLIDRLCDFSIEKKPAIVCAVLVLTVFLGIFSLRTEFDSNVSHINYMTRQQREDLAYFSREMMGESDGVTVYVVASGGILDEALGENHRIDSELSKMKAEGTVEDFVNYDRFIPSKAEQARRLSLWRDFLSRHPSLESDTKAAAKRAGFSETALSPFSSILSEKYEIQEPEEIALFSESCHISSSDGEYVVSQITVPDSESALKAEGWLEDRGVWSFDMGSVNSSMADSISDNFNYIGWACGCIVFFFLWISLGSVELALLSFIPMAVSWLWILGLMSLLGMQFNIVNIILATFIFGQGDDYTIFMTEGCCYEYAFRRRMLSSYKRSIIISALIMFIGIGTLIFAKHPALRSLAEVTIAGMFSVVLMAGLFPPLIFGMLVRRPDGSLRPRPLSFSLLWEKILRRKPSATTLVLERYRYKGVEIYAAVRRSLRSCTGDSLYGERELLYAYLHPEERVEVVFDDEERVALLRYAAEGFVPNLSVTLRP